MRFKKIYVIKRTEKMKTNIKKETSIFKNMTDKEIVKYIIKEYEFHKRDLNYLLMFIK
jgi:hypothetical protein